VNSLIKQRENSPDEVKIQKNKKIFNRKLLFFLRILACFDSLKNVENYSFFFENTLSFIRSNNEDVQKIALQTLSLFENHHINVFLPTLKKLQNVEFHLIFL